MLFWYFPGYPAQLKENKFYTEVFKICLFAHKHTYNRSI